MYAYEVGLGEGAVPVIERQTLVSLSYLCKALIDRALIVRALIIFCT